MSTSTDGGAQTAAAIGPGGAVPATASSFSLWRAFHWGPITAITIIKWITFATLHCNLMWYPPANSLGGLVYSSVFLMFSGLTLYHFFCAMCVGPGFLPSGWKPPDLQHVSDEILRENLQECHICTGFKAPRAHHCRKCGRCVMKMDHHCPWINTCVGHLNHGHFTAFLLSAVCGSVIACVTLSFSLYYGLNRSYFTYYGNGSEPQIVLTLWSLLATLLGLGLSIGVIVAVGLLFFFQFRSILRNQTGIEDWILEKADYRHRHTEDKFLYPYNLGRWKNFREVFYSGCAPKGDGYVWAVIENTDQYSLTREQLAQKADKKERSREYEIIHPYSGSWFPVTHGLSVCCRPPCTDEPRIPLALGDKVIVTRWKKYWLYGDKVIEPPSKYNSIRETSGNCALHHSADSSSGKCGKGVNRVRGWFPRGCAVHATAYTDHLINAQQPRRRKSGSRADDNKKRK